MTTTGRPALPEEERHTRRVPLLFTEEEHAAILAAAKAAKMKVAAYIRARALEAAQQDMAPRIPAIFNFGSCRVCSYPVANGTIHQDCLAKELKLPEWTYAQSAVITRAATNLPYRAEVCTAQTEAERGFLIRMAEHLAGGK